MYFQDSFCLYLQAMNLSDKNFLFLLCCGLLVFFSCKPSDSESRLILEGYEIEDGFDLEVSASEPLIQSPIAIDFDNQGRMWVLEMPGYMPNIDGTGEEEPVGRILILEDKNEDGHFEKAKTFLDGMILTRAMKLCYGGLLYAEPPNLWFVEIDGDQPGKKTLVDAEYVTGGNIEHQPNGLDLNIDNWIYSAKCVFRYRMKDGEWLKEKTSFRGQWGITHDDDGRLFYNDNSNPLYGDFVLPNQLNQNPFFKNKSGENEVILKDRRVYPIQATAVNRGYIEGVLDENNYLKTFTSACGPVIYRGASFTEEHQGNAFVCGPEVNLVKRIDLSKKGYTIDGQLTYENKEFLISNDEAFRPVNLYNGPDGAMYVVDYHNGIIQHKVYMTAYLRELYLERGLDTIVDYGRILKVSRHDDPMIKLAGKSNEELIQFLSHKNGWVRDRTQQLLIDQKAKNISQEELNKLIINLKTLAISNKDKMEGLHALWTLEGLDAVDEKLLLEVISSYNPSMVNAALQQLNSLENIDIIGSGLLDSLEKRSVEIDLHIAMNAFQGDENTFVILEEILDRYPNDTMFIEAILSSLSGFEKSFHYHLTVKSGRSTNYPILGFLKTIITKSQSPISNQKYVADQDTKTIGLKLFKQHCASCHGAGGMGIKNLAPPLYNSEYIEGDPEKLILISLHGLQGPITVNGQRYELNAVMPGLKDNKDLSDQDIANILSFVRNAFSNEHEDVKASEVKAGRKKLPKGKLYTEGELSGEKKEG